MEKKRIQWEGLALAPTMMSSVVSVDGGAFNVDRRSSWKKQRKLYVSFEILIFYDLFFITGWEIMHSFLFVVFG